jgi:DNA invertase Pin-like site-specific DNA recombinase
LVPTSAPDFFTVDTPTAVLVRQVLGAISQFEKAMLVAKLKAARDRKAAAGGHNIREAPEAVAAARELPSQSMSLRAIAAAMAERGMLTSGGRPYSPNAVLKMVGIL